MAVKYEDILRRVNGFGTYQKLVLFFICVPQILNAITTFIPNFILAEHKHRCRIPWMVNDRFSNYNDTATYNATKCTYTFNSTAYHCTDWVYDQTVYTESLISSLNMVCDKKFYRSHLLMATYIGNFAGSIVGSLSSDLLGRKPTFAMGGLLLIVSNIPLPFANNFYLVFILRLLNGAAGVMQYITGFILVTELVVPKRRMVVAFFVSGFYNLGLYVLVLMAYFLRDWHELVLYSSIPLVVYLPIVFVLPESPRWLLIRDRKEQATAILKKMSKVNKSSVLSHAQISDILIEKETQSFLSSLKAVIQSKNLIIRLLILSFNWAAVDMTYYGISMNVGKLGGDVYFNVFIAVTVGIVGEVIGSVTSEKIGRKRMYTTLILIGGIACLSTIFPSILGNKDHHWITLTMAMVGKLTSNAAFLLIYLYTAELAPTVLRGVFVSLCSCLARVGSISSSYIGDLGVLLDTQFGRALPLIIYGVVGIVAGLLCLFLPATLDKPLPDTTQDAEDENGKSKIENDSDFNLETQALS